MKISTLEYYTLDPINLNHHEDLDMNIENGLWRFGPNRLITMTASLGIVLAAYNEKTKTGLLGSFMAVSGVNPNVESHRSEFNGAFLALNGIAAVKRIKLWLGGGTPLVIEGVDVVAPDRAYAESCVEEFMRGNEIDRDNLTISWSKPERSIAAELDPKKGTLMIHDYPDLATYLLSDLSDSTSEGEL